MKKVLAVVLSVLMALMCCVPAFATEKTITTPAGAYAEYDKAKVAQNDADYIAALDYDQIAGILLDWLDRKIAAVADDFNTFEVEVMGQQVAVDLDITGIDSLLQYKDHIADLEGDFAELDISALNKTRADGDINFIYSIFEFMAANADTFGKVFRWDDQVFDYGKVGEFIEANFEDGDPIRDFYDDYLVTGNIQEKFVAEIASEMGYTIPKDVEENRTETFDETISNGIKAWFLSVVGEMLSQDSIDAVNNMDLRTTDVYTLVKEFVGLLQNDYKDQLDGILSSFLSALQGMIAVLKAEINVEPPTLTVGDANGVIGTYKPTSTDFESYMPKIYSPYKDQLEGTDLYDMIEGTEAPADVISGTGTEMAEKFVMDVAPVPDELTDAGFTFPIEISFSEIEDYANEAIAEMLAADANGNGKADVQEQIDAAVDAALAAGNSMASMMGITLTGSVTINSVTVSLAYKGYATDDTFVVEVTAVPSFDITYGGNVWTYASFANITPETIESNYIQPVVDQVVTNPVATVVVSNLSGADSSDLANLQKLAGYIDTEAEYNDDILDVITPYDEYKGVVGQANRILVDTVNMILSPAGEADLGLVDGSNENLYSNLQKICAKVSGLLDTMKQYISREDFIALAQSADISAMFASEHGFNAGMIYDMDFSSVENALDCGIRVACDLLAEDDEDSIFYEFHMRVEDLDTLDAIAVAAVDMVFEKVMKSVDLDGWTYRYTAMDAAAVDEGTLTAMDAIWGKLTDIIYEAAVFAVDKINSAVNDAIDDVNEKTGLNIGEFTLDLGVQKNRTWSVTLEALADRFIALADGIMIPAGTAKDQTGLWNKLTTLASVIPMNSMFSNYNGLEAMNTAFFTKALDGDLGDFLAYFEVKQDDIAGDVPVTYALIKASDYIVDRFFPDTVQAELYTPSNTVQEIFTGSESDQGIAARNMVSINNRKSHIVPAVLDLIREVGLLPSFACDHTNTIDAEEVPSTCTVAGTAAGTVCADCGMVLEGCEALPLAEHKYTVLKQTVEATCTTGGYDVFECEYGCGETTQKNAVSSLGHDYTVYVSTVNATCTTGGYDVYKCSRCDATTQKNATAALNHDYTAVITAPTCTEQGYTTYTCTRGDSTYVDNYVAAKGHNYVDGVCTECGAEEPASSPSFWQRIVNFFQRIVDFFRNLFSR